MKLFSKAVSYFFHPVFVPMAGTLAYFILTPKYSPLPFQSGTILPIFILTIIVPIISYLILTNIGAVSSVLLPNARERRYPLYIMTVLFLLVLFKVIPNNFTVELHYYFIGMISACAACLALLYVNFRSSLHVTGITSFFMYLICLSIHFEINITLALAFFSFATGLVATSRLYLKTHTGIEVAIAVLIGALSQLLTIEYWL